MILVDTGPLVAAGDRASRLHDECVKALATARPPRLVPGPVIALAERLGVSEIATLDQRHFRAVRPRHVVAFDLVPEIGGRQR